MARTLCKHRDARTLARTLRLHRDVCFVMLLLCCSGAAPPKLCPLGPSPQLRRDADPLVVLNQLYKKTALQKNFAANWMAVSGLGQMPERLTLRRALTSFLEFRVECVRRRTRFLLNKAEVHRTARNGGALVIGLHGGCGLGSIG